MKRFILVVLFIFTSVITIISQEAVVINKTGFDIYNIYISPSGMEQWSEDLQPYDVIMSGHFKTLDLSVYNEEAIFDFRFIDVDGDEYIKKNVDLNLHRKVVVSLDDLAYIMDSIKEGSNDLWSISVKNNTGITITELYISPHDSNSWGTNLIHNDYMENKKLLEIDMNGADEFIDYDIRMDSSEGTVFIKDTVELSNNVTVIITSSDKE